MHLTWSATRIYLAHENCTETPKKKLHRIESRRTHATIRLELEGWNFWVRPAASWLTPLQQWPTQSKSWIRELSVGEDAGIWSRDALLMYDYYGCCGRQWAADSGAVWSSCLEILISCLMCSSSGWETGRRIRHRLRIGKRDEDFSFHRISHI